MMEIPRLSTVWEHYLTNLLGHDHTTGAGRTLRQWVHFQGVHSLLDLISWDLEEMKADPTQTAYHQDDCLQGRLRKEKTHPVGHQYSSR